MGKITVAAVVLLLSVGVFAVFLSTGDLFPKTSSGELLPRITVGDTSVQVMIADTPGERRQGLSGVTSLPPTRGMLFVFEEDDRYSIWMKDMHFPLDILWISADGVIVDIEENVAPETYPEVFEPEVPVRYVLEMPAGFVEAYNIVLGDHVSTP